MKTKIKITNSFHQTTAHLWVDLNPKKCANGYDDVVLSGHISRQQYLRARRRLCGMSDCFCSTFSPEPINGLALELSSEDVYGIVRPVF